MAFSGMGFSMIAFLIITIIRGTIMLKISIIGMEIMLDSQIISNLININNQKRNIKITRTPKIIIRAQGQMIFMTYS